MIQFNLLPDVKQQYIKSQSLKRTAVTVAVLVGGGALALLIMLAMVVLVFQKTHISGLNGDIKKYSEEIKSKTDIQKVLTVQNQLNSLPDLHDKKPVTSKLYEYLAQVVPANITLSQLDIDYDQNTVKFIGTSDGLATVNKFVDTLKFTTYTTGEETEGKNAFSEVVLTSFSKSDQETTYDIDAKFDPAIFSSAQTVKLTVPNIITSRSSTEKPTNLFKEPTKTEGQ